MINFSFVKSQFKIIKIEIIIFFILLFVCTIPALTLKNFVPFEKIINKHSIYIPPTGFFFFNFFFFFPSIILFFIFGFILINKLLLKEINKGYFSSWLTTPMSRQTILNSKIFAILSSILFLNISILLIQLILFSAIFKDFNSQISLYLFLYFISLIFVSILFTSIAWIISCYFCDKQYLSIFLISGILTIFFLFYIIGYYVSQIEGLENLKYLKSLTIISFLKQIDFNKITNTNPVLNIAVIKNFDYINFAWQFPVMLISIGGLFISGNFIFCKKNLHL